MCIGKDGASYQIETYRCLPHRLNFQDFGKRKTQTNSPSRLESPKRTMTRAAASHKNQMPAYFGKRKNDGRVSLLSVIRCGCQLIIWFFLMKCVECDDKTNIVCAKRYCMCDTGPPSDTPVNMCIFVAQSQNVRLRHKLTLSMYEVESMSQFTDSINNKQANDGTIKPNDFVLTTLNLI